MTGPEVVAFQLPLSGSLLSEGKASLQASIANLSTPSLGITRTSRSSWRDDSLSRLSTPSLGITNLTQAADAVLKRLFQLPLSGSPVYVIRPLNIDDGAHFYYFQLPLSGSQLAIMVKLSQLWSMSFNSLSRDHARYAGVWLEIDLRTFNSLSRDHLRLKSTSPILKRF